ncbi:hypothetical protein VPHD51_0072 [Vibrio phage D51]
MAKDYIILGFETGCNPCNQLKDLMAELVIPYQFVDAKLAGNPTALTLKKMVKELKPENQVVPALFKKLDSGNLVLVGTGIDKTSKYIKEHYNND